MRFLLHSNGKSNLTAFNYDKVILGSFSNHDNDGDKIAYLAMSFPRLARVLLIVVHFVADLASDDEKRHLQHI